jgi:Nucleotidyl transferase AbiEii toxin, Type IV TA system
MKPLRTRLQQARRRLEIPWEVLERDYLLSWILAGIGQVEALRETLIFKGGTALKKCYFGDYRFSEDLDFSGLPGTPTGKAWNTPLAKRLGDCETLKRIRVLPTVKTSRKKNGLFLSQLHFFCFNLPRSSTSVMISTPRWRQNAITSGA